MTLARGCRAPLCRFLLVADTIQDTATAAVDTKATAQPACWRRSTKAILGVAAAVVRMVVLLRKDTPYRYPTYESINHAAAAGIQQPGTHVMHTGDYGLSNHQTQYRASHSPPNYSSAGGVSGVNALSGVSMPSTTAPLDTPVLTPASVSSYPSSGHSPMSSHSRTSVGSNQMYPSLPSVTGMSDLGAGYPTTTSAPASSLSPGFDVLDGRRYSGGRLQRQAPNQDGDMMEVDDRAQTPKASDSKRMKSKNSSIDPALRGGDEEKSSSESAASPVEDRRQEEWIENIRMIETLRKWIEGRLKNGDYEKDDEEASQGADKNVEIAKLVEEKMADADVKYPTLPSS